MQSIEEVYKQHSEDASIDEINSFFNKRIYKEIYDNIVYYVYEFNTVTDEDVTMPDLSEYEKLPSGTIYYNEN